ncbi:MAG: LytR/AlgR family response regulator transcription factor [Rhodothermales bacterium]|jgi:two-component system LytT family response regulator
MDAPLDVLIVDDEALARDTIRLLLQDVHDMRVVAEASDGPGAVEAIRNHAPDLVFLDVQMPGLTGLEVISEVGVARMPPVVFVTAFNEYAVKAFETSAIDYLVKPFSDDRFEAALQRARNQVQQLKRADLEGRLRQLLSETRTASEAEKSLRFMVKERNSIRFVEASDIDWVEAAGDYVILHCGDEKSMIRETMAGMEKKLPSDRFVRIHRSSIVCIPSVREIKPYFHGDYIVYLKDGRELKLSRRYWPKVEQVLGG